MEHAAHAPRELEKELGRDVLCPVALADAWKDCRWPERLRVQIMEYTIIVTCHLTFLCQTFFTAVAGGINPSAHMQSRLKTAGRNPLQRVL